MGQAWGAPPQENFDAPPYGRRGGMRTLSPELMRMQGWAALAEGARGLWFFLYQTSHVDSLACRDAYWRETPMWDALGDLFKEVGPLSPLLLRLKRTDDRDDQIVTENDKVIARTFRRRDIAPEELGGLYVIVVNTDEHGRQTTAVSGPAAEGIDVIWDVKRQKAVGGGAHLAPGEGTVLWLGSKAQASADRALLKKK
jgi:hypothetical protein